MEEKSTNNVHCTSCYEAIFIIIYLTSLICTLKIYFKITQLLLMLVWENFSSSLCKLLFLDHVWRYWHTHKKLTYSDLSWDELVKFVLKKFIINYIHEECVSYKRTMKQVIKIWGSWRKKFSGDIWRKFELRKVWKFGENFLFIFQILDWLWQKCWRQFLSVVTWVVFKE